jgi:hypothetical protein
MRLSARLGEAAASFDHFFVTRPLERNEATRQMETALITKATAG